MALQNPHVIRDVGGLPQLLFLVGEPGMYFPTIAQRADDQADLPLGLEGRDDYSPEIFSLVVREHCLIESPNDSPFVGLYSNYMEAKNWATICDIEGFPSTLLAIDTNAFMLHDGILFEVAQVIGQHARVLEEGHRKMDYLAWRTLPLQFLMNFRIILEGHPSKSKLY